MYEVGWPNLRQRIGEIGKSKEKQVTISRLETDHDFTLPVKLAERGMPTAKSALPDPVKSPMAKEYPK